MEPGLGFVNGKTYEVTFWFTSDASGRIKYHVDAAYDFVNQEYDVVAGANTFTIRFTAGADYAYNCLELGGLGAFKLTFTGISVQEV